MSAQLLNWSPETPQGSEVTLEGDEVYTRGGKNLPPPVSDAVFSLDSEGWTIHFIERNSGYWVEAQAGLKDASLFEQGVKSVWNWAKPSE